MKPEQKIVIKNYKGRPTIPENFEKSRWLKLEKAILAIQNNVQLETPLEELYHCVENMCSYKMNEFLYDNLYILIENNVKNVVMLLLSQEFEFLETVKTIWISFCKDTNLIKNIFLYLDRTFILNNQYLMSVWCMSLALFKENVILNPTVKYRLIDGILAVIELERQGEIVRRDLLHSLIYMLIELQVYEEKFEHQFLQATDAMYKAEGEYFIIEYDITQYLYYVNRRILEERDRVKNYLDSYTEKNLLEVLENQLVKAHLDEILEIGLPNLIENNLISELTLLFNLLDCISSGHIELCLHFRDYLKTRGRVIVINPENDRTMIQDLIDFKDKIDNIVTNSFRSTEKFVDSVRDSFKFFINQRHNKPAELLAKFVDCKLRCKYTSDDIESVLDKIMVLFRFVQGKDVFEAFYKRDLAKRLLLGKSASQDAENSMIGKLKQECGGGFTAKLEGMFQDIGVSQGINNVFRQHLVHIQNPGDSLCNSNIDMCINVLTSSYWPTYPVYEVNMPSEMVYYQNLFMKFYMSIHSGRKLQWQPNLGQCIVKANFRQGKKELQVSVFQAVVLLLFNAVSDLSYKEIQSACDIEENELKRTLQSLACGKSRILIKIPKGKDIDKDDAFTFNDDFTDKLFRIKINQVQMKETVEEQRATEDSVIQDRQFQIDAAIVRIMKQKKTLSHNFLISELYILLDIPVKPADLKKRIEQLIDRDYVERDKDNANVYKYIA